MTPQSLFALVQVGPYRKDTKFSALLKMLRAGLTNT
jgi:hypothetical protein